MDKVPEQSPRRDFAEVYAEHVFRVFGFIGYRVRGNEEAEDLTQIVFEKAIRAWARYDPKLASELTWLIAIARNVVIDYLRQRRDAFFPGGEIPEIAAPEQHVSERGLSPELAAAIDRLKPREQTVLALRFGAELTGAEIAELLGLSTDNVHQILSRSLRGLRAELDGKPTD